MQGRRAVGTNNEHGPSNSRSPPASGVGIRRLPARQTAAGAANSPASALPASIERHSAPDNSWSLQSPCDGVRLVGGGGAGNRASSPGAALQRLEVSEAECRSNRSCRRRRCFQRSDGDHLTAAGARLLKPMFVGKVHRLTRRTNSRRFPLENCPRHGLAICQRREHVVSTPNAWRVS
jgi:hypothetical protein